ncbi:UNVERIFIED_CONTAM: hypothetical protein FKN15_027451 [Acipenser sinensis]
MTDAAHLLTDFASMLLSLFSLWMASRPATKTMSFGWHRAEEGVDGQAVLKEANEVLQSKFDFHTTTIQIENYSEDMQDCQECQDPRD